MAGDHRLTNPANGSIGVPLVIRATFAQADPGFTGAGQLRVTVANLVGSPVP